MIVVRKSLSRPWVTAIAVGALAFALSVGVCADLGVASASASVSEFGAKGTGAGEFVEPLGIAVFQETGDVYVADKNNARVDKFGPEGALLFTVGWGVLDGKSELEVCSEGCRAGILGSGAGQFNFPDGVAVDSAGDFYVVDSGNHRVQKFDSEGHFLLTFGKGVNLATEGNVCNSAKSESCGEGQSGFEEGQFSIIVGGIAVDSAGTVYVGDFGRVEKFDGAGAFVSQFVVGEGAGLVLSLAVSEANEVYVVGEGIAGVHRYDPTGTELGVPFDTEGAPEAVALGPSSEIYVAERNEGATAGQPNLVEYDATGAKLKSFDIGTEGGSRGIAFGNTIARVYVLNREAVRLVAVPPAGPLVAPGSEALIDAKPSHARVEAVIDAEGSPTKYHFEYGETTAYGRATTPTPLSEEKGLFAAVRATADLTGLKPNTVYHFRTVAEDELGHTTFGLDATLTTPPPVLISGESTTQATPESARLNVEIDPQGAATLYHFEYGPSSAYGQSAPVPDADAGADEASASHSIVIEHLNPGTVYHYRVVAHNTFGTVEGPDRVFTTTTAPGSGALADGRVWEMVSPPAKSGSSLEAISEEGGLIESSEQGNALAYIARASVGTEAEPEGNQSISDTQLLAKRRGPGVWETQDITTPHDRPAGFHPGRRSEYLFFSGNLSKSLVEPFGATLLSAEATERTPYLREPDGVYVPLVTAQNVAPGTHFGGEEVGGGNYRDATGLVGTTPDLHTAVLSSPLPLTGDFAEIEGSEQRSLYRRSESGNLQLVSWLPATEESPEVPAITTGVSATLGQDNNTVRHAVSENGNRFIFNTSSGAGGRHLYLRDVALGETLQLDVGENGTPGSERVRYQDASADGHVVYFTDEARLTADSSATDEDPDLYECEIEEGAGGLACKLKDLTVVLGTNEAADVRGNIVGADQGGDRVYFVANGRLTPDAVRGNCPHTASAGEMPAATTVCNLYVYDAASGETRLVAVLSGRDFPDWSGETLANMMWLTARVSPNGRFLAFMSQRSLTGYDNRDARSGVPDEEVFEYGADSAQLACVSCNRTGARPSGVFDSGDFPGLLVDRPQIWSHQWIAASVPGWTNVGKTGPPTGGAYQSRYLADDGRLFFNSSDALVPGDVNGQFDVYEYERAGTGSCGLEAGCVALMSSGLDGGETAFLDASSEGKDVFFLTAAKLSLNDTDAVYDVYDAHVCTVAADCPVPAGGAPPPCETSDACRAAPSPQPDTFGAPASSTFSGAGNLAPTGAADVVKAKRSTKAQLLVKALKSCRKDRAKKRRVSCERRARKRYGAREGSAAKGGKARRARSGRKGGRP